MFLVNSTSLRFLPRSTINQTSTVLVKYLSNQVPDYVSQLLVRFVILLLGFDFGEIRALHKEKRLKILKNQLKIEILMSVTELTNNVFVKKRVKLIVVLPL